MSTADKIDDNWPHTHGTVEGYDHGCRGGSCPAGDIYGLSCKLAKSLSRNDYRYGRLVRTGATVAEVAAEFDLVGTSTPETVKPKPAAKTKRAPKPAQPAPDVVQPAPEPEPEPVDDAAEQTPAADSAAPVTPASPSAQEIRKWARDRGYELPSFGRIPKHIRAHYDEAHTPKDRIDFTTAEEIRAFVGPLRHENGQINASAVAQEATLRERAGLPSWIAALDAPTAELDTESPEPDTEIPEPATEPADMTTDDDRPVTLRRDLASGELVVAPIDSEHNAAIAQQAVLRPEWGYVALKEDLERANAAAAIALEERDRARGFAARLFDELQRAEATAAEQRERSAAALADYLRDLAGIEQLATNALRDLAETEQAFNAEAEGRRIAESALQLTLEKWGELKAANESLLEFSSLVEVVFP